MNEGTETLLCIRKSPEQHIHETLVKQTDRYPNPKGEVAVENRTS